MSRDVAPEMFAIVAHVLLILALLWALGWL
jgi:hypothetical protein